MDHPANKTAEIEYAEKLVAGDKAPDTHTAQRADGREVQVTALSSSEKLTAAMRDLFSPEGIAGLAAYLQNPQTKDDSANRQIRWFRDLLVEMVGGHEHLGRLYDEIGI